MLLPDKRNMTNQGGPSPGDNPQPGDEPGGPTPDSQPNEIRATDSDYRYRGGRQGVGEVPDPREVREDAGNHRETADQDAPGDSVPGDGGDRKKHPKSRTRNPE